MATSADDFYDEEKYGELLQKAAEEVCLAESFLLPSSGRHFK
jgi:hypothetical protein